MFSLESGSCVLPAASGLEVPLLPLHDGALESGGTKLVNLDFKTSN